ncbi:hypothetical protein [Microseira wollei]|uniref:Uncharacterized protein n=1 Tax=Microseira wollei NIES-4236 TaxID=2530354 RepID=A0AAV3XHF9_9CYAN|nr:hypothetical protein [Microseira wollei]GET40181.1 hypothetical protein MiSe_49890 [Microseira wollei NIES-4236]
MTTFRDFFIPTLLGVVVVLPPANAQAVNDQILLCRGGPDTLSLPQTNSLYEPALEILASGQDRAFTGYHLDDLIGQHLSLPCENPLKAVESANEVSQSASSGSKPVGERWEKEESFSLLTTDELLPAKQTASEVSLGEATWKRGYLVKSSTADQPKAEAGAEPQLLTHADAVAQASSEVGAGFTRNSETRFLASLNGPLQLNAQLPAGASSGVRILNPQPGTIGERTTSLIVQYPADQTLEIKINGNTLDPETPTQKERDSSQNLITQTWYNIRLRQGENVITVQAGNDAPVEVRLNVENNAAKLEILPEGDRSVRADGRSTVTITGTITDSENQPLKGDTVVTLTTSAGQFVGADQEEDQPGFQAIARDGRFTVSLQSSLQAQQVRVRAAILGVRGRSLAGERATPYSPDGLPSEQPPFSNFDEAEPAEIVAYTQVEFVPNLRPSIVSGVANLRIGPRGTNFWGSMRDFLNPDDLGGTEVDFDAALFATGPVGEWLFTGAFNTARALNQTCDGNNRIFGGIQFCEQQYPVYGDSSRVDYITPSRDSFYVRFERASRRPGGEPDYGMWGDYYTNEFSRASQLFSANNRALHGFKANYSFGSLQVTALFSPDTQGFQRDAIVPDGTSGLYFLSRRLVVPGSENIFIETEELNRPGTVLERRQLSRGPDYEIDYDRGTLRFRRPIQATEFDLFNTGTAGASSLLVRRIVVTYQHEGGSDTSIVAGRLQYNFNQSINRPAFAGVTYWREDMGMREFDLFGFDFMVSLGNNGRIVGEYARSNNDFIFRGNRSGSAYRLEVNGAIASWLAGRAYYRSVEENFLNNATVSFSPGQTRYGASLSAAITTTTALEVQYDYERNFGIASAVRTDLPDLFNPGVEARPGSRLDNTLNTFSAGLRQRIGRADFSLSYVNRVREDRAGDLDEDANQIVARLNVPLLERLSNEGARSPLLTFRAQHEQNLGGSSDPLYPTRTTFGLDWAAFPGVTMRLAHQFFDGGLLTNNSITSLDTIVERELFKDTTMSSRYSVLSGFGNVIGQGALGIRSRIRIAPGLRLLLGYERVSDNIFGRTAAGRRFPQPFAVGQSAASLGLGSGDSYSIGLEYTDNPDFKASGRFEYSTGSFRGDNMLIEVGAAGKISRSITALLRYYQANSSNQLLRDLDDTINLRVGFAYRDPEDDKFNALMRYEFRRNPAQTYDEILQGTSTDSTDHLFALEAIYAPNWRWEFYGKYAFRISDFNLARNYSNNTATNLAQLRATYRLGYRTDIAGEVRWIGQEDYNEWGWAAEFGYYLTPDLRLGLGYSFGSVDDRDFSGFRSEGGPYFQVTFKVNELFGGFGRQRVVPRQQRESEVVPVAANLPISSGMEDASVSESQTELKPHTEPLAATLKFLSIFDELTNFIEHH